jgi:hypothetical protein
MREIGNRQLMLAKGENEMIISDKEKKERNERKGKHEDIKRKKTTETSP